MYARVSVDMLEALEKAVFAGNLADLVPEDLEAEAHNTLWRDTDDQELTLMKCLPSVTATSVKHEYDRFTSFGYDRNSGLFPERALPPESQFATERVITNIGLQGELSSVYLLAHLEKTINALGANGAVNINRAAARLNFLRKKNRNLYKSDTSTDRQGANGPRFEGLEQQIREGTDGTVGASPFGSHVIDMEGQPLVPETLRAKAARSAVLFGQFNSLFMDPFVRADFESQLDPATRLGLPINMRPFLVGQNVGGLQTQGKRINFFTDNVLTPIWYGGQYTTDLVEDAPTSTPTVAAAVASSTTSKFDSNPFGAGDVFYIVTELQDEKEGLGTRYPTGTSTTTVANGEKVTLTITPGNPLSDTVRIYRGYAGQANTEAYWMADVKVPGTGAAITVVDDNLDRPGTSRAFGLRVTSMGRDALAGGMYSSYADAAQNSAKFFGMPDSAQNTVSVVHLGPQVGLMKLASFLAQVDRPLMYSAYAMQVRNPLQNVVFKNIGTINN